MVGCLLEALALMQLLFDLLDLQMAIMDHIRFRPFAQHLINDGGDGCDAPEAPGHDTATRRQNDEAVW